MALAEVTRPAVEEAIKEFDRLGRDAFLEAYHLGRAKRYFLRFDGELYDSKAIVGYAHSLVPTPRVSSDDFVGGEDAVAKHLRALGFTVEDRPEGLTVPSWDLEPGAELLRQEVLNKFGGPRQGGIAPSGRSPNILLFSTKSGQLYGYDAQEGWLDPDTYLYTGEGQTGDQTFVRGNAAVRDHLLTGRALRLFEEVSRTKTSAIIVRYAGEFVLDQDLPYERRDAPDGQTNEMRSVIVFRLRPVGKVPSPALPKAPEKTEVIKLAVESHHTETFMANPSVGLTEVERREAALVGRFSSWLVKQGHDVGRQQIRLPGGAASLYTDLFDFTTNELFEAKGASTRNHIRLAIGQLLDYGRFVKAARRSVLLPVQPQLDLVGLLNDLKIDCVWETESGEFHREGVVG